MFSNNARINELKKYTDSLARPDEDKRMKQDRYLIAVIIGSKVELDQLLKNYLLCISCYYGLTETAKEMISRGANVNAVITETNLSSSGVNAAELLLEAGIDISDYQSKEMKLTHLYPVQIAVLNRHYNIADLLIQNGASVNKVFVNTFTSFSPLPLLLEAARCGDETMMEYLLHNGAKLNKKTAYGMTALHLAVMNNKVNAANLLLRYEADMHAVYDGKTAMEMVSSEDMQKVFDFRAEMAGNRKKN